MNFFRQVMFCTAILALFSIDIARTDDNKENGMKENLSGLPVIDQARPEITETAIFALGWFWGIDSRFGSIPGVVRTESGYCGGKKESPDYRHIGDHSEAVLVEFDPSTVSFSELLKIFWESHDPTHQSFGRQYRNVLFYHYDEQKQTALASLQERKKHVRGAIVTEIAPAGTFTTAEDYHQKYLLRKAGNIYHDLRAAYPEEKSFRESTAAARLNGYLGCNGSAEVLNDELGTLGLSPASQQRLVEIVTTTCGRKFSGVTCPK